MTIIEPLLKEMPPLLKLLLLSKKEPSLKSLQSETQAWH
jgi:hypothetical protein